MTDEEKFLESIEGFDPGEAADASKEASDSLAAGDEVAEAEISALGVLEQVTKERDEYFDMARRLQAEFENFRKRTTRQQSEAAERASLVLIERMLPVLDALDLALAHIDGQEDSDSEAAAALTQIAGLARTTLQKEGLERIDEVDVEFDPTVHDAVSRVESDEEGPHDMTVSNVMRAGYRLKGSVIRPAMVAVKG